MKRKKGTDYLTEWSETINKLTRINNEITDRLLNLATSHPNAIIGETKYNDEVSKLKAKNTLTKQYIESLNSDIKIHYILKIEEWIESQWSHKQLEIEF